MRTENDRKKAHLIFYFLHKHKYMYIFYRILVMFILKQMLSDENEKERKNDMESEISFFFTR